ncbi:MAG: sporulation transcriptional regulator SpoIIID [Clostridia bacterium]|nr:sporulation transcriptional regulator SpoIIID [Clostridia bacterium]
MTSKIEKRVLTEAQHISRTHDTIRKTAQIYGISKSTVHNDLAVKLQKIDGALYCRLRKILQENFDDKHIRGGEATKQKYARVEEKESEI